MTPGEQPYCGTELLPHATDPEDRESEALVLCDLPVHGRNTMHRCDQYGTSWRWQDAEGNWITLRFHCEDRTIRRGATAIVLPHVRQQARTQRTARQNTSTRQRW